MKTCAGVGEKGGGGGGGDFCFLTHKLFIDYVMSALVIRPESKPSHRETGNVYDMRACESRGCNSALLKSMGLWPFILAGGKLHLEGGSGRTGGTTLKSTLARKATKSLLREQGCSTNLIQFQFGAIISVKCSSPIRVAHLHALCTQTSKDPPLFHYGSAACCFLSPLARPSLVCAGGDQSPNNRFLTVSSPATCPTLILTVHVCFMATKQAEGKCQSAAFEAQPGHSLTFP